uniref:Uncharacterized protein n=1 Tax=Rhizophora mucronata TaxID=61149 RepID=A0A2P2M192_RHIMU
MFNVSFLFLCFHSGFHARVHQCTHIHAYAKWMIMTWLIAMFLTMFI